MSKKKRQEKKMIARKAVVKQKLSRKREKAAAEAKLAKLLAQLRKEMSNDEPRSSDTTTEGDFLGGFGSPTENRTDV
jgi:hypothetical protein